MTLRTLRNWQKAGPAKDSPAPGRPRLSDGVLAEARAVVEAELERQGWDAGEEPITRALGGRLPRARVRRVLRDLKAERRRRSREHALAARVHARDTLWSMDATHLGRDGTGGSVKAEVVREVASTRSISIAVGPPASGPDVVQILDCTAFERDGYPLVLLTDNGPQYRCAVLQEWCEQRHVLHLFSLPHTPQHNPASEHGMGELKRDAALGKGVRVSDSEAALAALERSRDRLDAHRPRRSRGWKTALAADAAMPHWSAVLDREVLWRKATCALQEAVLSSANGRARLRAEREAILATLAHFNVITRTRGGRPWTAHNAEEV